MNMNVLNYLHVIMLYTSVRVRMNLQNEITHNTYDLSQLYTNICAKKGREKKRTCANNTFNVVYIHSCVCTRTRYAYAYLGIHVYTPGTSATCNAHFFMMK